jgi:hypothetical protein
MLIPRTKKRANDRDRRRSIAAMRHELTFGRHPEGDLAATGERPLPTLLLCTHQGRFEGLDQSGMRGGAPFQNSRSVGSASSWTVVRLSKHIMARLDGS